MPRFSVIVPAYKVQVRRVFLGQTAPVPAVVPLADRRPTPAARAVAAPAPALATVRP
ncbi:hypothetical protein OG594_06025 [Streptomyces sp. NBC_01214]|uniref:hypothetical protein n=1 Tax=Streptomyces sp. NBC_01214 TaxID=2903777 RepID=UPI00225166C7|nr:hypothetical protein [Streptomyces sp. NBC_01214]MCX4801216.1 hypothetical protein [Streptomyces sp. NBC_01214]